MPKDIVWATKETVVQPKGGLVIENPQEQDHVLGAAVAGPDFEVLVPDGQWHAYLPGAEIQRNRFGDTFMCVSFSHQNACEIIVNRRYGDLMNMSDIFLGVGSGTTRGEGNSKRAVAEWARLNGFVLETDYPYTPDMTLDQVYAPLTAALLAKGKANLDKWSFLYKWVGSSTPGALKDALRYSPLQVDVTGTYPMNEKGIVQYDKSPFCHEVLIFGYEDGVCWHVFDSEASQYIRFAWDYPFGSPMLHSLKKKATPMIYKEKGKPALAVKHPTEPLLIAFSGGSVRASDLFFALYGATDFKQLPIKEVDKFEFPIGHLINTNLA